MEYQSEAKAELGVAPPRKAMTQGDILRECEQEAFAYRSVPFMIASILTVTWALKTKRLLIEETRSKVKLYLGTTAFAFLAGKLSYRMVCARKLIAFAEELETNKHLDRADYAGYLPQEQHLQSESTFGFNEQGASTPVLGGSTGDAGGSPSRGPATTNRYGDIWSQ